MATKKAKKRNPILGYFRESKEELEKVTWPNAKETHYYAILTIILTILIGAFFFSLDWVFKQGLSGLINLVG